MTSATRILAFDGGGIRGVISLVLLRRLLREDPDLLRRADVLAGTSTGALIALGLASGRTPEELLAFYLAKGPEVFYMDRRAGGRLPLLRCRAPIPNRRLAAEVRAVVGEATTLGELPVRVVLPAFDLDNATDAPAFERPPKGQRRWKAKVFHNFPGEDSDGDRPVWKVAMYASAVPAIFPAVDGFIDGGVFATNPSMVALAQTQDRRNAGGNPPLGEVRVLNLGTGETPRYVPGRDLDWGLLRYGTRLVGILQDGVSDTSAYQVKQMIGARFHRLSPPLGEAGAIGFADASRASLERLVAVAEAAELTERFQGVSTGTAAWLREHW